MGIGVGGIVIVSIQQLIFNLVMFYVKGCLNVRD